MLTHNRKFTWLDLYLQNLTGLFDHDKESLLARYSSNHSGSFNNSSAENTATPVITSLPDGIKNHPKKSLLKQKKEHSNAAKFD